MGKMGEKASATSNSRFNDMSNWHLQPDSFGHVPLLLTLSLTLVLRVLRIFEDLDNSQHLSDAFSITVSLHYTSI